MKKRFVLVSCLLLLLMTMVPMTASAAWQTTDGKTYYYQNGTKATGLTKIGKYTYYFNTDGVLQHGWQDITVNKVTNRYYFTAKKGRMVTGIKKISKKYYLFSTGGVLLKGLQTYKEKVYYGTSSGALAQSQWVTVSASDLRYFGADCAMVTSTWVDGRQIGADGKFTGTVYRNGWVTEGSSTYYYVSNVKQTGFQTISGKRYYFDSTGVMKKNGWFTVGSYTYYATTTGALTTSAWKDDKYLTANGTMAVGWTTINSHRYYFNTDGSCASGFKTINGTTYYFVKGLMKTSFWIQENGKNVWYVKKNGSRASGFLRIKGKVYYFNPSTGRVTRGFFTVDGKLYYGGPKKGIVFRGKTFKVGSYYYTANSTGALLTGLQTINGKLKYYNPSNGRMARSKKVTVNGVTYYFSKKGNAVKNKWVKISGKYYYFGSSYKMVVSTIVDNYYIDASGVRGSKVSTYTGWKTVSNLKYYYVNGDMVTGFKTISGSTYYFSSTGAMQTGVQTISGRKYYFYPSGIMAVSTTIAVGSKQYTINASGIITAETTIDVSGNSVGAQIAKFALQYVGNKYVYGGTSLTDGADCSGFVMTVFANFNIKLLRVADDQWKGPGSALIASGYKRAVTVSASNLLPGDLVFYGSSTYASHVGIYIGSGNIVHASNSQAYPAGGIKISNMNYTTPVGYVRYWS